MSREVSAKMSLSAKILGDHHFNDFVKDVKVAQLIGMPFTFKYVTTLSALSLEVDAHGAETVMIIGCMNSILDSIYLDATGKETDMQLDKLRLIFDSYFMHQTHLIYLCPPLGRPTTRITTQYNEVITKFKVSYHFLLFL